MKFKIWIFLFLVSYIRLHASTLDLKSYKSSPQELVTGKYLNRYIQELKSHKLHSSFLQVLHKRLQRSSLFRSFQPFVGQSLKISRIKNTYSSFIETCTAKNSFTDQTSQYFDDLNRENCRIVFMKILAQDHFPIKATIDTPLLKKYFIKNLPIYLTMKPSVHLLKFFKKSKTYPLLHKELSQLIKRTLASSKINIYQKILPKIEISQELASYIQFYGTKDKDTMLVFKKEFFDLKKQYNRALARKDHARALELSTDLLHFFIRNKSYFNEKKILKSLRSIGKDLVTMGKPKSSFLFFKKLLPLSNHKNRSQFLFYILWPHIVRENVSKRIRTIQKYHLIENFDHYDSRLKFWIAYTLRLDGEKKQSKKLYKKLIDDHPLSFYATIASRELYDQFSEKYYSIKKQPTFSRNIFKKLFNNTNINKRIKRLVIWTHLNIEEMIHFEYNDLMINTKQILRAHSKNKKLLKIFRENFITYLMKILNFYEYFLESFRILHSSNIKEMKTIDPSVLRLLYPNKYTSLVRSIDKMIDVNFVLSIIRQESAFDTHAKSPVGARGLMQIMPTTAKNIERSVTISQLHHPPVNIRIGIKYLLKLLKKFNNDLIDVLASYNAGESRLRKWRKNIFSSKDPLSIIESIPYHETRKYIQYIYRNMFFYNYLQDKEKIFTVNLKDSFTL